MNDTLKKEIEQLINVYNLNCSIEEFESKANWYWISQYQKNYIHLSEEFMRYYSNNLHWNIISVEQTLSEQFLMDFKDKVDWYLVIKYQQLTENMEEKIRTMMKEIK